MAAQSSMDIDTNDSGRVYCTSAMVKRVGRAVAISLEDATLPGNAKNKHMTIMYRGGKRWSDVEIATIYQEVVKWMVENNGSDQAPVTFTLSEWGRKSMAIKGDLHDLCLHLRQQFVSMSGDSQRIPHVELFVGKAAKERGSKTKQCPMRDTKSKGKKHGHKKAHKGRRCVKSPRNGRNPEAYDPQKARLKLTKVMSRIQRQKEKKQQEIALLDIYQSQLATLCASVDVLDGQTVNAEFGKIKLEFKRSRKGFNQTRSRQRRKWNHRAKRCRKEMKGVMKLIKKKEKGIRKAAKQSLKLERKQLRKEMKRKLEAARLAQLPSVDSVKGDLHIHVDGYNLIGCDSQCRKGMRKGMKKSRLRLVNMLQKFMDTVPDMDLGYNILLTLWFDGHGADEQNGGIEIKFGGGVAVDDHLVAAQNGDGNNTLLMVTSDRKLTVRLHDNGVSVMKSGRFYKRYLMESVDKMDVDQEQKEDVADHSDQADMISEEFVHVISGKMDCGQNDQDEGSLDGLDGIDGASGSNEDDECPDEMEGSFYGTGSHEYSTPIAPGAADQAADVDDQGDGEDSDFMEIFGDEVEDPEMSMEMME